MSNIQKYKETYQKAIETLKILTYIPFHNISDKNEYKLIERFVTILSNFLESKTITSYDIKTVNEIINIATPETIFNCYLYQTEKEFCEREFLRYLENPTEFKVAHLENFIENGEFLKLYIEYKIENYQEQMNRPTKEKENDLIKII